MKSAAAHRGSPAGLERSQLGRTSVRAGALSIALVLWARHAQAQVNFSQDWQGPTIAQTATGGMQITEADDMLPGLNVPAFAPVGGFLPNPQIQFNGSVVGVSAYGMCVGHAPGTPCGAEVDALSFGNDYRFQTTTVQANRTRLFFSVDEWATGRPGSGVAPNVFSEAAVGDSAADIFTCYNLPNGPLPPGAVVPPANVGVIDGDGKFSGTGHVYRGVGLVEPTFRATGVPDSGDNLDALQLGQPTTVNPRIYFSLDAAFPDLREGVNNSGSALQQAPPVSPAAVLVKSIPVGTATIYAQPSELGLDLGGPGTDDLDVLILADNGDGVFQRSAVPYDWLLSGMAQRDMLIFSVRRGSAVIGQLDSIFGIPIEPGDLLVPPPPGPLAAGRPGIFIAAEDMGLSTSRTDMVPDGDEMDAGATSREPCYDCNGNGVEDAVDIATGTSADTNNNGIPDECERSYTAFCTCTPANAPCSNDDSGAGCKNSTGMGGLLTAAGTTSVTTDDLVLTAAHLPIGATGLWLRSTVTTLVLFNDGDLCIGSRFYRFGMGGPGGSATKGPGMLASSCAGPPAGCMESGSTWHFQFYYRNVAGPCGTLANLTNGMSITWTP